MRKIRTTESKMLNKSYCHYCKEYINKSKDDYCTLVSHQKGKIVNQDHWHRKCFKEWLDVRIETKLKILMAQGLKIAKQKMELMQ
jgi:hypothetical protein